MSAIDWAVPGRRRRRRFRAPPGSSPGLLVAHPDARPPRVRLVAYGPDGLKEIALDDVRDLRPITAEIGQWPVVWIEVAGLADPQLVRALGELLHLHALALEDVLNLHQRPKVEQYADHLFFITRVVENTTATETEQLSMFLGPGYLLTFVDHPVELFEPVRERIRAGRGRIRGLGLDYLAYALLDAGIDSIFPVLEAHGEKIEALEQSIGAEGGPVQIRAVHEIKRDLLMLRRAVWPQREMIHQLGRDCGHWIGAETQLFLRDAYDHVIQLTDLIETYREIASGLVDLQLSAINTRMNEIMKVLTVIATIFIPLGFIASLYGMNFDRTASPWNMPELGWRYGYPLALLLMAIVGFGLLAYFRAQGWIGGGWLVRRRKRP